jgi:hypothetical protein
MNTTQYWDNANFFAEQKSYWSEMKIYQTNRRIKIIFKVMKNLNKKLKIQLWKNQTKFGNISCWQIKS